MLTVTSPPRPPKRSRLLEAPGWRCAPPMSPSVQAREHEAAARRALLGVPARRLPVLPAPTPEALQWRAAPPPGRAGLVPAMAAEDTLATLVLEAMAPRELLRLLAEATRPTARPTDVRLGRVVAEELARRLGAACARQRDALASDPADDVRPEGGAAHGAPDRATSVNGLLAEAHRATLQLPRRLGDPGAAQRRAVAAARRALCLLDAREPGRPRTLSSLLSVVRALAYLEGPIDAGLTSAALQALPTLLAHPTSSPFRLVGTPAPSDAWLDERLQPVIAEVGVVRGDAAALAALRGAAHAPGTWLAHWLTHDGAADWVGVALVRGQAPLLTLLNEISGGGAVPLAVRDYLQHTQIAVRRAQRNGTWTHEVIAQIEALCATCIEALGGACAIEVQRLLDTLSEAAPRSA